MEQLDKPIMPKFNLGICECIGSTIKRVLDLGTVVEPCLASYPKHPERLADQPQGTLEFPEDFGF